MGMSNLINKININTTIFSNILSCLCLLLILIVSNTKMLFDSYGYTKPIYEPLFLCNPLICIKFVFHLTIYHTLQNGKSKSCN